MNVVKNYLSTLAAYLHPGTYGDIAIVLLLLLVSYIYSFIFFGKDNKEVSFITRVLTGTIVLINAGWILLLLHSISPAIIAGTLIGLAALVMIIRKLFPQYFLEQAKACFASKSGTVYSVIFIILFLMLLPRAYNGFFRWDETSFHLAYPQYWINNGGFAVDYSMRYPVYSFGLHIIYTLLLALGSLATIKIYTGFFLLFFFFGIKEICRLFNLPGFYNLLFLFFVLLIEYFNEWSFTGMLEPVLWTYSLFTVIAIYKAPFDEIFSGKIKSFVPAIILMAILICIKNFFIAYVGLLVMLLVVAYAVQALKAWKHFLKWVLYALGIVLAANLITFVVAFRYSGDPIFPLITTSLPAYFTQIWQPDEIANIKKTLNETSGGILSVFSPAVMARVVLITIVLSVAAFLLCVISYFRKIRVNKTDLVITGWLLLSILITQALFPVLIRYSYFLIPAFIFSIGYIYRQGGKMAAHICFLLVFVAYARPHTVVDSMKYYLLPFRENNMEKGMDIERMSYGNIDMMNMLEYMHQHREVDSINICELREYRLVLLMDGKTVHGDDVGMNKWDKICNCTNSNSYTLVPRTNSFNMQGCNIVYENGGYILYNKPE